MAKLPFIIPYDPDFLEDGFHVPLPRTRCTNALVQNGTPIDYIHFSLVLHQQRKTALYAAYNLDMSQKQETIRRDNWAFDPRVDQRFQMGEEAYTANPYDKGHLVRREIVTWGTVAQDASEASFYYTNSTLQHKNYNRSHKKWLGLEDWVMKSAGKVGRLCVFAGPIYTDVDDSVGRYRAPAAFWKIIVLRDPSANGLDLAAVAFLMKQNEKWGATSRRLLNPTPYLVPISHIEAYTGLRFDTIRNVDEFHWQQATSRSLQPVMEIPINGAEDIIFSGRQRRARGFRVMPRYQTRGTRLPDPVENTDLYICAARPNPKGVDAGKEWIALTNQGMNTISLDNYSLKDKQGGTLVLTGVMLPFSTRVFFIPKGHSIRLANTGDELRLLKGSILVHLVSWEKVKSRELLLFDPTSDLVEEEEEVLEGLIPGAESC